MKLIYILKKGFQCYPPCLAQLLYLDDLGVELEVYHGKNTKVINKILDERKIVHHTLMSDRDNVTRMQSIFTMLKYTREIKKILKKIDQETLIWFGNCESFITITSKLKKRNYVLSVLELDNTDSVIGKNLKKVINSAKAVVCCEKHRAAIMQVYYGLDKQPYVMPNKPYETNLDNQNSSNLTLEIQSKIDKLKDKFVVLYQGIITKDRPLDKIAKALKIINNKDVVFAVMGRANDDYMKELSLHYDNIEFLGYVPSPQHLEVTKIAKIGVVNYDYSCLNNLFCAPNKIYEYAKFGLPMIASNNLGLTETVGNYRAAECVDFNDVDAIVKGILAIMKDQEEYSLNATRFNNDTDNTKTIKKILDDLGCK